MKNKILLVALLSTIMLSGALITAVKAVDGWPNLPSPPATVTATFDYGVSSYFITTLTNVPPGYDVTNGPYPGWCADKYHFVAYFTPYVVELYNTLGSSLPPPMSAIDWNAVNYILNHKQGPMMEIQNAINYFTNPGYTPPLSETDAWAMINGALADPGYEPSNAGDILAVLCYPPGFDPAPGSGSHQPTLIELTRPPEELFPKQFTAAHSLEGSGFAEPGIIDNGLNTTVVGLKSGPSIFWEVTYFFANTEEFLGSQYDGNAHYFQLWDKWGGNLMLLDSAPTAFNPGTNILTLGSISFNINYAGYTAYVNGGLDFTDSRGRPAVATLHTGDQQQNTNPGKGRGTANDGSSYDMDLVWDIGYLEPGQSSTLTVFVAPGKNPAGKLMFTSCGLRLINTGPRVRVYGDVDFTDFLYAIEKTTQLGVIVSK